MQSGSITLRRPHIAPVIGQGDTTIHLTFHQNACNVLGLTPSLDSSAVALLERRECELGFTFPDAMRELYTLVQRDKLLVGAHDVTVRPLDELGFGIEPEFPFCHFLSDYQGQWNAYVFLNGDEDPDVRIVGDHNGLLLNDQGHPVESMGLFSAVILERAYDQLRFKQMQQMRAGRRPRSTVRRMVHSLFRGRIR